MSKNTQPLTDPATGRELPPRAQPGYYPGWDVMREAPYWDASTRKVVTRRLEAPKPLRFFSAEEAATMAAVLDRVLPQDDRDATHRIPLLPELDDRLASNRIEGYRYEDMPSDGEAYRLAVRAFNAMAQEQCGAAFAEVAVRSQELMLHSLAEGEPAGAKELWSQMNVKRFWTLLVSDACTAYYAHPWAWNEIGYGGPAYPRGYMRLENGEPEPWEFREQRYGWAAPQDSVSQQATSPNDDKSYHGQAGTH